MGKIVPWSSWNEWKEVYAGLFSTDVGLQLAAVARAEVWRARGRVPMAIEITAALIETIIKDRNSGVNTTDLMVHSEGALRSQYALAIIRMVNGITDSQQKGRVAVSVASLASSAGLPRLLVDLRHEATHNELPSLQVLRVAAQQALAWLRSSYWDAQRANLNSSMERVTSLLAALQQSCTAASSKALGQQQQQEADSSDDEGMSTDTGGYQAADGQRQRKQLLSDLRSMVPPACAAWVADSILSSAAVSAPAVAPKPATNSTSSPAPTSRSASRTAGMMAGAAGAQGEAGRASAKGWQSCMATLVKCYPNLLPLLLEGAARRLTAAVPASAEEQQRWQQWVSFLLEGGSSGDGAAAGREQGKKRSRSSSSLVDMAAAGHGSSLRCSTTAAQLQHLLVLALAGHSSASQQGDAARAQQLLVLCQQLAQLIGRQQGQVEAAAGRLVKLVQAVSAAAGLQAGRAVGSRSDAAANQVPGVADLSSAMALQQELLAKLAVARQRHAAAGAALPAAGDAAGAAVEEGATAAAPAAKRWRRCSSWRPCAIGCLPHAFDDNGLLSHLTAAALVPVVEPQQVQAVAVGQPAAAGEGPAADSPASDAAEGEAVNDDDLDWQLPDGSLQNEEIQQHHQQQEDGVQIGVWRLSVSDMHALQQSVAVL